mgnify:CR=1 FL=1
MATIRQNRVSSLLQKELATFFQRESKTYFGGAIISVTVVRVSSDLAIAKVYLSIFAKEGREEIFRFIDTQTSQIRYMVGKQLGKQLRVVPELHFYYDDSLDYAEEINKL